MNRSSLGLLAAVGLCVALAARGPSAAADGEVKVGDVVENLAFKDIRYLPRSLDDFPDARAFVLVFTNTACPLVQRYMPTLTRLEQDYRTKGVQFLVVNAGDDAIVAMAAQAVRHEAAFPFVKDADGTCVRALGVRRTPEAVVLDAARRLRYRGRIDDQYRLGGTRAEPTRHDLREALDAVLAGRDVAVKETPVDGCLITLPEPRPPAGPVTFADHVSPLLRKHCQECHRPGTAAPFALVTYKQVAARADAVAEAVADQRMPPWYASPEHGTFTNKRGLSADERDTLLRWVRTGMARGDDSKLPPPPAAEADSWQIGKPDLVVSAPEHDLPAAGLIPYKYELLLKYVFPEDTWVQGVQIRPDNPRVLHHCNMAYFKFPDGFRQANFITGTVPGGEAMTLDHGVGFRIPKGSSLVLQIHYVTTGKPEKCRIAVGFKYADGLIQKNLKHVLMEDRKFAIPPGAPAHRVAAGFVLPYDAVGVGLFVHMHLRGKDMTFRAQLPDGSAETLLVVPNYSFDWQMPYRWEPGKKRFPKGTRLECVAHYDNSPFNAYNPDPRATVRNGQQTHEEMMNGFVFFTDAAEELNLEIDPKTGRVRNGPGGDAAPKR
jgi:thiol-disulfide isomerase/thioredoxin